MSLVKMSKAMLVLVLVLYVMDTPVMCEEATTEPPKPSAEPAKPSVEAPKEPPTTVKNPETTTEDVTEIDGCGDKVKGMLDKVKKEPKVWDCIDYSFIEDCMDEHKYKDDQKNNTFKRLRDADYKKTCGCVQHVLFIGLGLACILVALFHNIGIAGQRSI